LQRRAAEPSQAAQLAQVEAALRMTEDPAEHTRLGVREKSSGDRHSPNTSTIVPNNGMNVNFYRPLSRLKAAAENVVQ
jgi:hypothetical protein